MPFVQRRGDPEGELRRAAALDELEQRVEVAARVPRHTRRQRQREAGRSKPVPPPGDELSLQRCLWCRSTSLAGGGEPVRKLLDETVGEHVRHVEDVVVDLVVGRDVRGPAALDPGDRFLRRQGQMLAISAFILASGQ